MRDSNPTFLVERQKGGGWAVLMTPPGFESPIRITGFATETKAKAWIEADAAGWLAAHLQAAAA
jgi:hypothetical protein